MGVREVDILFREVKPYAPLKMKEILFWLRIMKEHSLFMKLGFSCTDKKLIAEADKLYALFAKLEEEAAKVRTEEQFACYVAEVRTAAQRIFAFKRYVLHLLLECKITGFNYPLLIDHISREAMYFIKILDKINDGEMKYPTDAIINENVFWLKIMVDHVRFVRGLLDPSERSLMETADRFSEEIDQLFLHARDLGSMLWHFHATNSLIRFEKETKDAVEDLLAFIQTGQTLLKNCAALALVPPLLVDHVRRETEHFLEILSLIQKDIGRLEKTITTC